MVKNKKEKEEKKSFLKRKTISKRVFRPSRVTYVVREQKPAPYVSRYFKDEVEEAKKALFFK